jgi:hypothetical protein
MVRRDLEETELVAVRIAHPDLDEAPRHAFGVPEDLDAQRAEAGRLGGDVGDLEPERDWR